METDKRKKERKEGRKEKEEERGERRREEKVFMLAPQGPSCLLKVG